MWVKWSADLFDKPGLVTWLQYSRLYAGVYLWRMAQSVAVTGRKGWDPVCGSCGPVNIGRKLIHGRRRPEPTESANWRESPSLSMPLNAPLNRQPAVAIWPLHDARALYSMLNSFRASADFSFYCAGLMQLATAFSAMTATEPWDNLQQQKFAYWRQCVSRSPFPDPGIPASSQSLSRAQRWFWFLSALVTPASKAPWVRQVVQSRLGRRCCSIVVSKGEFLDPESTWPLRMYYLTLPDMTNSTITQCFSYPHSLIMPAISLCCSPWRRRPDCLGRMGFLLMRKSPNKPKAINGIDVSFVNQATGAPKSRQPLSDDEKRSVSRRAYSPAYWNAQRTFPALSVHGDQTYDHNGSQFSPTASVKPLAAAKLSASTQ